MKHGNGPFEHALDIGGQDVNSSAQGIHPHALFDVDYWDVLDIYPGDSVTIVADGTTWRRPTHQKPYDLVLTTETLEHVEDWQGILETCSAALGTGGVLVGTWAGEGRPPHSSVGHPDPFVLGEHYANVTAGEVENFLREAKLFAYWELVENTNHGDVYLYAVK